MDRSAPCDHNIYGILAFNDMVCLCEPVQRVLIDVTCRDKFVKHLRPFACEGKIIEATNVTRFFYAEG